jgi:hypothetical protein
MPDERDDDFDADPRVKDVLEAFTVDELRELLAEIEERLGVAN